MKKALRIKRAACIIIVIAFLVLMAIPIIKQGIMCNDELQLRLLRKSGINEFLKTNFWTSLRNGRVLGAVFSGTKLLSYISADIFISRVFDFLLILVTVLALMYLLVQVTEDKKMAGLAGFLVLGLLPITYEHTVPNAFVSVMCIPMTLLFFRPSSYTQCLFPVIMLHNLFFGLRWDMLPQWPSAQLHSYPSPT